MSPSAIEYRDIRWADFPSYQKLMLQAPGAFERATGLDQTGEALFNYLHRRRLWTPLVIMRSLGIAPFRLFVGVSGNQVLGSAGLTLLPKAGYVFAVVTDSTARNQGIASRILEEVHRATIRRSRPWVALDVDSDNEVAIRLYQKLGYRERVRFNWHVGPTPATEGPPSPAVSEVPESKMREVAAWVNVHQLQALRDALPATARMLSHHESITQIPGSQTRTWRLSSSGQTAAVVRGFYLPMIKTVFMIPAAWDSAVSGESLLPLAAPLVEWARSLGAARTEAVVPEPPGVWGDVVRFLGLPKAVSTILMVRPSSS